MSKGIYDRSKAKPNKGIFKKGHIPTSGAFEVGHKNSIESRKKMSKHWKETFKDKTKHPRWKGDNVGYTGIHMFIRTMYGVAHKCENGHKAKKYEWANISGKYSRNINDWMQLCVSCHRKYDAHSTKLKNYETR